MEAGYGEGNGGGADDRARVIIMPLPFLKPFLQRLKT